MVFTIRCCKFFVEDIRPCTRTQVNRSYFNKYSNATAIFPKAFGVSVEPACLYTWKNFSCCNDVKHRFVLFLPSIQYQIVSMEPKTNFKVKVLSPQFYILSILNTLFFMSITKFLNQTTAPTRNSQTTLMRQFPMFLDLSILISHSCKSSGHLSLPPTLTVMVIHASPSQFPLDISNRSSPHSSSWSSTDSFDILFLTL